MWEIRPDELADQGRRTVADAPELRRAGTRFLEAVAAGGDDVHHEVLGAALDRYHGTLVKAAAALPDAVMAAGSRLTAVAAAGVDADRESLHALGPVAGAAGDVRSRLRRDVNAPRR
ncbi:hypothetical protein [Mumia xiangluensis]|uniref:Excreted virulence factor EspC, type VII ESX diderm n=1 Tax=Mumia xiangluensis TaxID=1678900 RepID=A0ABW1QMA3_9ACTN